jgi:hypothetical protein
MGDTDDGYYLMVTSMSQEILIMLKGPTSRSSDGGFGRELCVLSDICTPVAQRLEVLCYGESAMEGKVLTLILFLERPVMLKALMEKCNPMKL